MEYQKQLEELRRANKEAGSFETPAELLCRVKRTDRLCPVHTLCLYHGAEPWDGPRTLKDMMDFGGEKDEESLPFSDYAMHLYCINEETDFSLFRTELKELFMALKYQKDREGFMKLMEENEAYRHLEADTIKVMSVTLNMPKLWENREKYMIKNNEEEKEMYDMCQAMREWIAEERKDAEKKGEMLGEIRGEIKGLIETCREFGASREDTACRIMRKFSASPEDVRGYMEKYWK